MNLTGPPIALHSADYLAEQLSTPRYKGAQNLRTLVSDNEQWDISSEDEYTQSQYEQISRRLYGVVFGVATQIVEEGFALLKMLTEVLKLDLDGPWGHLN